MPVENNLKPYVAVIIPYFQRRPGILEAALNSISAQTFRPAEIVVVDDGSPVPARQDVEAARRKDAHLNIKIIEQPNRGPAAARNRALDYVSSRAEFVAFLDSDDRWAAAHCENGVYALSRGHDFYFSNGISDELSSDTFSRAQFAQQNHLEIDSHRKIYRLKTSLVYEVISTGLVQTPTVMYRLSKFPHFRMPERLHFAGEDQYLWIKIGRATTHVAFGATPEVHFGRGINIFASSGWGSENVLSQICDFARLWQSVKRDFALEPEEQEIIERKTKALRADFTTNFLHKIRSGNLSALRNFGHYLAADPAALISMPILMAKIARTKFKI